MTKNESSLLAAIAEYHHGNTIDFSLLHDKEVYIKELRFKREVRNVVHLLTNKLNMRVSGISITNITDRFLPANIKNVIGMFYGEQREKNVQRILCINGARSMSVVSNRLSMKQREKVLLKTITLTVNFESTQIHDTIEEIINALVERVDVVVLTTSTGNLYIPLKMLLQQKKIEGYNFVVMIHSSNIPFKIFKLNIQNTRPIEYMELQSIKDQVEIEQGCINPASTEPTGNVNILEEILSNQHLNLRRQTTMAFNYDVPFYVAFHNTAIISDIPYLPQDFIERMADGIINAQIYNKNRLQHLDLSNCLLTHQHLCKFIPYVDGLLTLTLNGNPINSESVSLLIQLMQSDKKQLRHLSLSNCRLTDDNWMKLLTNSNHLKFLNISSNKLSQHYKPCLHFKKDVRVYEESSVDISNCDITDQQFMFLIPLFLRLEEIDLSFNNFLTDTSLLALEHDISKTLNSDLKSIKFAGCFHSSISSQAFAHITNCISRIDKIDYKFNKINQSCIKKLSRAINSQQKTLQSLELTILSSDDFVSISTCWKKIEHLELNMSNTLPSDAVESVMKTLLKSSKKQSMFLYSVDFSGLKLSRRSFEMLSTGLIKAGVKCLNFSGNKNINLNVMHAIKDAILSTDFIQSLNLSDCELNDVYLENMSPCIPKIQFVDIHNNDAITTKAIELLIFLLENKLKSTDRFQEMRIGQVIVKRNAIRNIKISQRI